MSIVSRDHEHSTGSALELRDIVSSLLSWMGQCAPREYVRWLRETQPFLFRDFSEDEATSKLEAVTSRAWSSLADPAHHRPVQSWVRVTVPGMPSPPQPEEHS